MKTKVILTALALTLSPTLALAECSYGHEKVTLSCADGKVWDENAKGCITPTG